MPPKFGTSGLRGLVTELTPKLIADHVRAFLRACPVGTGLYVGRDLRPSSPDISKMIQDAAVLEGIPVVDCGETPTPALALAAMTAGAAAVMVTGSHIPADRNGLKFYTPTGEITKADEAAILANLGHKPGTASAQITEFDAGPAYVARYFDAFGVTALRAQRIGVYSHSTVGRELLAMVLTSLGAKVHELGRSDHFIPVDTEAVDPATRAQLADWAAGHDLHAIVSMDGDGDRPLLTDAAGNVIHGDVLGQITARQIGAKNVVTPISSNTGVQSCGFEKVHFTRIGSPYVIAGMTEVGGDVAGYEANGGFLLGFDAKGPAGPLPPLMTRDSVLPIVTVLHAARETGVARLVADGPQRFTAADRLQEIPTEVTARLVTQLARDPAPLLGPLNGEIAETNQLDGLRMTLADDRIVHLRPSGNAPELRLYVEAAEQDLAQSTLAEGLAVLLALAD